METDNIGGKAPDAWDDDFGVHKPDAKTNSLLYAK